MTRPPLLGWPTFLAIALAAQGWLVTAELRRDAAADREVPGYLPGDCGVYAAATDSLWRDGDLDLLNQCFPGRRSLAEALPDLEGDHGGEFGLAAGGYPTIKQSPVLSAAALPFYALLGRPGFLVFNLLVLNLLLVGLAQLAGGTTAARAVVLIGFLTSPLWRFAFNFSPDLFLCALLVWSVLAARAGRPTASGVLAGLAVSTKVYVAAFALPVPVVVWMVAGDRRWAALARFALGGAVGLTPGLAFNTWLFGAPWVTGYERQLHVVNGTVGLADHTSRFTVPPLVGLRNLLFDPVVGLWSTAPLWFVWPAALGLLLARREARPWVLAAAAVIGLNLALFACYDGWDGGQREWGNRYVFPALVFGFALVAAATGAVVRAATSPADPTRSPGPAEQVARA